ncbi:MAG: hypothetical protein VYB54_00325 [Pseudomonadota bacterium]|nr:hypothetical protein [Pseudomonadota bacterium]
MSRQSIEAIYEAFVSAWEALDAASQCGGINPQSGMTLEEAGRQFHEALLGFLDEWLAGENRMYGAPSVFLPRYVANAVHGILHDVLNGTIPQSIWQLEFRDTPTSRDASKAPIDKDADETAMRRYRSMLVSLKDYLDSPNWRDGNVPVHNIARPAVQDARDLLGDILSGTMPDVIRRWCFGKGRPGLRRDQRHAVGIAVRYIAACRAGVIDDSDHMRTVATRYGVQGRTVNRWLGDYPETETRLTGDAEALKSDPVKVRRLAETLAKQLQSNAAIYRDSRHRVDRPRLRF